MLYVGVVTTSERLTFNPSPTGDHLNPTYYTHLYIRTILYVQS